MTEYVWAYHLSMQKSILITGASSGIGYATVKRFYSEKYRVAATVRKAADRERIQREFPEIKILEVDLNQGGQIENVVGDFLKENKGIDILVNNAGYAAVGAIEDTSLDELRLQFETNFFALVHLTKLAIPYMRGQNSGRIIQLSSGFGRLATPLVGPYAASKFAVEGFSEALRAELLPFSVYVSLIEPGPVDTAFERNRKQTIPAAGNPYAKLYESSNAMVGAALKIASSPDDVVAKIYEAATVNRPRLRYEVGAAGVFASLAARFLPTEWLEAAMSMAAR